MKALSLLIARTLLVLAAFPVGALMTQLFLLRGESVGNGDGGLAVAPWVLVFIGAAVVGAVAINDRFLRPKQPEPHWLQSPVIRFGLRLVILVAAVTILFIAQS